MNRIWVGGGRGRKWEKYENAFCCSVFISHLTCKSGSNDQFFIKLSVANAILIPIGNKTSAEFRISLHIHHCKCPLHANFRLANKTHFADISPDFALVAPDRGLSSYHGTDNESEGQAPRTLILTETILILDMLH